MLSMMCQLAIGLVAGAVVTEVSCAEQCVAGEISCKRAEMSFIQKGQHNFKVATVLEGEHSAAQELASFGRRRFWHFWRKPAPKPAPQPAPTPAPTPPWQGVRGLQPPLKLEKEYTDYSPVADDVTKHAECNSRGVWLVDHSQQGLLLEVHGKRGCLAQKAVRPPLQLLASLSQSESESSKAWPGTPYSLTTNDDECQRFRRVAHSSNGSSLVMLKGMDSLGRKTGRDGHGGIGFLGHDPAAASSARDFQFDCGGNRCVFHESHLATGQMAYVQQNGGLILVTRHQGQAWAATTEDISLYADSRKCGVSGTDFGAETTAERCAMLVGSKVGSTCGAYFMWSATAASGAASCICCSPGGQDSGAASTEYSIWKLNNAGGDGGGGGGGQATTTSTTPSGIGFCSRCSWPWYGKFCQNFRPTASSPVDVLVIVFQAISTDLGKRIDQYRADLATYENLSSDVLEWDLPNLPALRPQRELRHLIKTEYVYREIRAVLLVGDYPLAWATFPGRKQNEIRNGPFLSYYTSFSGSQQFFLSSDNKKYTVVQDQNQRHTDIAMGIINQASEQEMLAYFDRLHSHRETDGSSHPSQKQWSFDGGDWVCDSPSPLYSGGFGPGSHSCHEGQYIKYECPDDYECKEENKKVYKSMLDNHEVKYEYYNARAHSWHAGFSFGVNLEDLINKPFSGARFFNLFHCSAAKTSERNLAFGMAIGSKYGLASVGTTHTGAMLYPGNKYFEQYLKDGDSWGEALRKWWNKEGKKKQDDRWHVGITAYGDPMVRMRGGKFRQGAKPGSLTEESAASDPMDEEELSNATLRQYLDHVFEIDIQLEKEHADDDVDFEKYEQLMTDKYYR